MSDKINFSYLKFNLISPLVRPVIVNRAATNRHAELSLIAVDISQRRKFNGVQHMFRKTSAIRTSKTSGILFVNWILDVENISA